jgi:hypothetical protein
MRRISFFFSLFFLSSYVEASQVLINEGVQAQCTSRQIDEVVMGNQIEQGGTNWCFAYSAANLLSFEVKRPVSTTAIAINYYLGQINNPKNARSVEFRESLRPLADGLSHRIPMGGEEADAIRQVANSKLCTESSVRSTSNTLSGDNYFDAKNESERANVLRMVLNTVARDTGVPPSGACNLNSNGWSQVFAGLKHDQVVDIVRRSVRNDRWEKLLKASCSPVPIATERVLSVRSKSFEDVRLSPRLEVDRALNAGKPVAIDLSLEALGGSKNPPFPSAEGADRHARKMDQQHALTVVGRKWNKAKNACEYVIRNSIACSDYLSTAYGCHNQHFNLTGEALNQLVSGVTWIPPKNK